MKEKFLTPKEAARLERDKAIVAEAAKALREDPTLRPFRVANYVAPLFGITAGNARRILNANRDKLNFKY